MHFLKHVLKTKLTEHRKWLSLNEFCGPDVVYGHEKKPRFCVKKPFQNLWLGEG